MNTMFGVFMFLCTPGTLAAPNGWLVVSDPRIAPMAYRVMWARCGAET